MANVNLSGCFIPLFGGPIVAISSSDSDQGSCDIALFGGPLVINKALSTEPVGGGPTGAVPGLFFAHG